MVFSQIRDVIIRILYMFYIVSISHYYMYIIYFRTFKNGIKSKKNDAPAPF